MIAFEINIILSIAEFKCFSSRLAVAFAQPLKPRVQSRMKMKLEQRRQAVLQLHLSDQQFSLPSKIRLISEV